MMIRFVLLLCMAVSAGAAPGPVAQWTFDEGGGKTADDSSGNGHRATLFGPTWAKQGSGHALMMDGHDDYVECGSSAKMNITGPVSVELWVKPMRKAHGETSLVGIGMQGFLLTYYNTEITLFYIGGGDNNVKGQLILGEWNHVAASFDGQRKYMWINGRSKGNHESKHKTYTTGGPVVIGTKGRSDLPKFKGMLDNIRLYNRALTTQEVNARFLAEANEHDFDPDWFKRPRFTPWFYLDDKQVIVETDFKWLQPLQGRASLTVSLASKSSPSKIIRRRVMEPVQARNGVTDIALKWQHLPDGEYVVRAELKDGHGAYPAGEFSFTYPGKVVAFPTPSQKTVAALPAPRQPMPFRFRMGRQGGFQIVANKRNYPFSSRISWPNGDYNHLSADGKRPKGEMSWKVVVKSAGKGKYQVLARGKHCQLQRRIEVFDSHVQIKDTFTNRTKEDLGLIVYHDTPVKTAQLTDARLSGHERRGRQADLTYPDYGPSAWFADNNAGMGIVPADDVFIIQAVPYVDWQGAAGIGTEEFAIAPEESYTLEWAVFPAEASPQGYYDFTNHFRHAEGRIGTITEAPGFITGTPHIPWRRDVVTRDHIDNRNINVGIIHSLSKVADDENLHVEGIELFREFPKEMALIRKQAEATHKVKPGFKVIQHIAHSIYTTNRPEQFADSRVIHADGKPAAWGDGSAFGKQRQSEGWKWWIFYPMPGNSFHDAMLKSVDTMMDDVKLGGGFMDGFLAGYGGMWTHDRWDGHNAVMDLTNKTIRRKRASVMLLSQPSMVQYARKIRSKGGAVVALHAVFTRTLCKENYIMFANESASGPDLHLAPIAMCLGGNTGFDSEKHIYLDMLDKLSWGLLYIHYTDGHTLTHRSMASYQHPITCEEIRSGLVRGPERIVTMNPGVYGWADQRDLHLVHKFDARGVPSPNSFTTTVDSASVRTDLDLGKDESAVIEPIPATLDSTSPVNTRVMSYDAKGLKLLLSGAGKATLHLKSGAFAFNADNACDVSINGKTRRIGATGDGLSIPIDLSNRVELIISAAKAVLAVESLPIKKVNIAGSHQGMTDFTVKVDGGDEVSLIAPQGAADGGAGGYLATQGKTGTAVFDADGNQVATIEHSGRAMVFDAQCNLYISDDTGSGGKWPVWRHAYRGKGQWSQGSRYCEAPGKIRALALDENSGALYIGLADGEYKSNVYQCAGRGQTPKLFCGVNSGGRQIQDLEVDPDGKVWLGMVSGGYYRYPLTGGFTPDLTIYNGGSVGGFAFGPDRNGDGRPELYGSFDNSYASFGYYDYQSGKPIDLLMIDKKIANYCMTFGPDKNGDGVMDVYIANYGDRTFIYDTLTGKKLGEAAIGLTNVYLTGQTPKPYAFKNWRINGKDQPSGRTNVKFHVEKNTTATAIYEKK